MHGGFICLEQASSFVRRRAVEPSESDPTCKIGKEMEANKLIVEIDLENTIRSIEARRKKTLKPLRAELLSGALHRYPHIEHLDQTLCPRIEDNMLNVVSLSKLNDLTTAATAEAKILEKLWLARCKLISDMGIGCIAAW
ncbi:small nuclear ribonucleoprotein U2B [Salix suchowensis]|nr:small nuclear ribonucleoprotein U2B [Salix suchowensis]